MNRMDNRYYAFQVNQFTSLDVRGSCEFPELIEGQFPSVSGGSRKRSFTTFSRLIGMELTDFLALGVRMTELEAAASAVTFLVRQTGE
jgi:hypothetical protein